MQRFCVPRVVALVVLLLHGSAFSGAAVLDAAIAARANATVSHVEENAGASCVTHDEATCQLCRVGSTSLCTAAPPLALAPLVRAAGPAGYARAHDAAIARSALHSRAPPRA
jgi:hypothetical protein